MDTNWDEHYIKKGDPSAPTYYIIRRKNPSVGIFSNYAVFAWHIKYALSKGYIPVIDMQNYPNQMLDPNLLGKENSWEYFFKQPLNIGLEQAYKGENIILSKEISDFDYAKASMNLFKDKNGILTEWRMLVKLGLLQIQPHIQKEIDDTYNKLFSPQNRVLGLKLRGTDYTAKQPKNHPIPPPIEYTLPKVILKARKWNCDKIFLATEDKNIFQICKSVLGENCVTLPKEYVNYDGNISLTHII